MSNKTEFTTEEVFRKIDTSLEQLDRLRADSLDKMAVIQQVQISALAKERQRLAVKYGANDVRVQQTDAKLKFAQGFTRDLKVEIDKANIQVPTIDRKGWMVHGRVLQATNNQEIQGIPDLTVSLVNRKGEWVQELGRACTDERGYFALICPPLNSESTSLMPTEPVFLMVSDRDRRVLHRRSEPLLIKSGQIIYREIFLSDSPECSPPPDSETSAVPVKILSLNAPTQLTVNQSGNFSAQVNNDATPPVTSHWEFGDGTSATGLTATHAYSTAGTYRVVFTATNSLAQTTRAQQVTVNPSGKAVQVLKLDVPSRLNVNQSGNFSAQINNDATPPMTSRWEFGDGTSATGLTATHVYSREGNYTVTFIATNPLGSDTRTSQVMVRQESPKRDKTWWLWFPVFLVVLLLYFFFRAQGYFI